MSAALHDFVAVNAAPILSDAWSGFRDYHIAGRLPSKPKQRLRVIYD